MDCSCWPHRSHPAAHQHIVTSRQVRAGGRDVSHCGDGIPALIGKQLGSHMAVPVDEPVTSTDLLFTYFSLRQFGSSPSERPTADEMKVHLRGAGA